MAHEFWNDQPSLELAQDIVVTNAGQVLEGYDAVLVRGQYPNEVENLTPPAITGTPAVGQALTASPGTWNLKATTFHYQWLAGTTPVGTDSPPTRRPRPTWAGDLRRRSPLPSPAIGSATANSAATAPVAAPVTTTPPRLLRRRPPRRSLLVKKPAIKGSLEVGTKARVTAGKWNPADRDADVPVVRRRQAASPRRTAPSCC